MTGRILAIDRGTTNVKACLFDEGCEEVFSVTVPNDPPVAPREDWREADMERMWRTAVAAIGCVLAAGYKAHEIEAVSLAGQGNGLMLVDAAGRPVRNGILSVDRRSAGIVGEWQADGRLAAVLPVLRLPLNAGSTAPLLAWLARHEPEALAKAKHLLFSKDWIRFRLTGELATDYTDASGGGLLEHASQSYARRALGELGLDGALALLPPLRHSSAEGGRVTAEAAAITGLREGTPVFVGAHDICACHNGIATLSATALLAIFGTWAVSLFVVEDTRQMPVVINHPERGHFLTGAGDANAGACLDATIDALFAHESAQCRAAGESIHAALEKELSPTGRNRLLFVPHMFGHALDANAAGSILGLRGRIDRLEVLKAVYEGIVLGQCAYLAALPQLGAMDEIWLAGGGAKSRLVGQIMADALGREVHVAACENMVGRGAAISAMLGLGRARTVSELPRPRLARGFQPVAGMRSYYGAKLQLIASRLQQGEPAAAALAAIEG